MKELIEAMMKDSMGGNQKGGKIDQIAEDIKAVADEMGIGVGEALEQVKEKCGDYEMDDDTDVMDDGMSEKEEIEEPKAMNGKKAIVIAMLKKKAGEKKEQY